MHDSDDHTILLVEDNDGLARLIVRALANHGLPTATASSGVAALAWLATREPSLMLLDLKLPDMDGASLIAQLRQIGRDVPFIVVSGHGDERLAAELLKGGALDYLMKDAALLEMLPGVVRRALDAVERQRQQRDLQEYYEQLLSAAGDGILGCNANGRISFANPAAGKLLRCSAGDLLNRPLADLWAASPPGADTRFLRADGSTLPVETTRTPLARDGRASGSVIVFRDLTNRRALEQQRRQSLKLEAIGRLASGVAHDFNNLLTVITGYGELLARNPSLDAKAREAVAEVRANADRAAGLTRQLLAFGRSQPAQMVPADLGQVVTIISKLLNRTLGEGVTLRCELATGLPRVRIDVGQIEQAVVNLVANARDAMPEGGTVTVATAAATLSEAEAQQLTGLHAGRHVCLSVSDTGSGMDSATRERIFEPFFTTKPVGHGTGLGLATAYGTVVQHNGAIRVESVPGFGTRVEIWLPVGPDEASAAAEPRDVALVAEDDNALRTLFVRMLQAHGYEVLAAADGEAALQLAAQHKGAIQLLLSDVQMPRIDGLALARQLLRDRPDIRVLLTSGQPLGEGLLPEGAHFLPKPFSPDQLTRRVNAIARGDSPPKRSAR